MSDPSRSSARPAARNGGLGTMPCRARPALCCAGTHACTPLKRQAAARWHTPVRLLAALAEEAVAPVGVVVLAVHAAVLDQVLPGRAGGEGGVESAAAQRWLEYKLDANG